MKFKDLFHLYYTKHALTRTRQPENARYFYSVHGPQWAEVEVESIQRIDVQDWCDCLGLKSKSAATRAVNMLAAIINWGKRRGYIRCDNPCVGVERFDIASRERFLLPGEFIKFKESLSSESDYLKDFFWLCLLTGARRGAIQAMRWSEIDLDLAYWRIERNKNGRSHTIPLSKPAVSILLRRRASSNSAVFVFPGPGEKGHIVEPKRAWKRILARAELSDLRIHDLRRTLGSYLAIKGAGPYVIGRALGHLDPRSTAVYARLHLDPIRIALEEVHAGWI